MTATIDASSRDALRGVRETRRVPFGDFELRETTGESGAELTFAGYACVTEQSYEMSDLFGPYTEIVRRGAFTDTLERNADVAFLLNHEGMTLARTKSGTLTLAEDDTGLHAEAKFDPSNPQVMAMRSAVDRGDLDEMSFAFRVTEQSWSPDYDQRDILQCNIHQGDVSLVNYGANPATGGTVSMRSRVALKSLRGLGLDSLTAAFAELRAGRELSTATLDVLTQVLGLVSDSDDGVDQAQTFLAELVGTPDVPQELDATQVNVLDLMKMQVEVASARL